MRLDTEFIRLPYRFDADRLREEVEQFTDDDWRAHPQGFEGNSALPFIAAGGDPNSDDVRGPMRPTPHLDRCPYLKQVLAAFESSWGRTRLMRIAPSYQANAHYDSNYYWQWRVRLHVPIVTHPNIDFLCADKTLHMAAGESWIFDTWKRHNVINNSAITRIHLVADTVGSPAFWKMVQQSERPCGDAPKLLMPPKHVAFEENKGTDLAFEDFNFPVILSPREQHRIRLLIEDEMAQSTTCPPESVTAMKIFLDEFLGRWQQLWSEHGSEESGWPAFQALMDEFKPKAQALDPKWALHNGATLAGLCRDTFFSAGVNTHLRELYQAAGVSEPGRNDRPTPTVGAGVTEATQPQVVGAAGAAGAAQTTQVAAQSAPAQQPQRRRFDRPIFILAAPRSGSTMLFEALAQSPDAFTVGGESHQIIESIPALAPEAQGFASNALSAELATEAVANRLRQSFFKKLHNRTGQRAPANAPLRVLEKTPKNALRVPFLNAIFPDALFIHLYRDPRPNMGGIIDAWQSGKFTTYPELPGWEGDPWSLLLVDGWRELNGASMGTIAAHQWRGAHAAIGHDLDQIDRSRWTAVRYEDLLENPKAEIERLCRFADLRMDRNVGEKLPNSRLTLTPPDPNKWKRHEETIEAAMLEIEPFANDTASRLSKRIEENRAEPEPAPAPLSAAAKALRSVHTTTMTQVLKQLGVSVAVSTYQAGKFVLLRAGDEGVNTHFRQLPKPMGVAYDKGRLAVGSGSRILNYYAMNAGQQRAPVDKMLLPRNAHITGDIDIHEMAWGNDGLWFVNTRFSCLCTLDAAHSFVPRWRPSFVSAYAAEDRCHLNGMAMLNGVPRWVTALGETDARGAWRENKANGGLLMDVAKQQVIARGLSMPHSPRFYRNKLWFLESGKGSLSTMNHDTGETQIVAQLPGFTRGLSFYGNLAFVGLSQVRETAVFSGLPITQTTEERYCGIWVVNIDNGEIVGFVRFEDAVQEIFAVEVLPEMRFPDILDWNEEALNTTYVLPPAALAEVAKSTPEAS